MLRDLPNPRCCQSDDVRHLCERCTAAYNAAHQVSGHYSYFATNNDDEFDPQDDLLIAPTINWEEVAASNRESSKREGHAVATANRIHLPSGESYLVPPPMID